MKRFRLPILATSVFFAVVSCSNPSRNYDVPDNVCGIPVSPSAFEELLPPGDDIEQRSMEDYPLVMLCTMSVDKLPIISATVYNLSLSDDLMRDYLKAPLAYNIVSPVETSVDGEYAISGYGGTLTQTACPGYGKGEALKVNIEYYDEVLETEEQRQLVRDFTEDFMKSIKKEYGCSSG